eukprot:m.264358 g.264358  ORF g.264358 m.264358 type:complete len:503 (-) comp55724_c0_seq1:411-1919(-)
MAQFHKIVVGVMLSVVGVMPSSLGFSSTSPTSTPSSSPTPAACALAMSNYCNGPALASCRAVIVKNGGALPLFPLHDTDSKLGPDLWRCYSVSALAENHTQYNTTARSKLYCTEDAQLRSVISECEHPTELVILESAAKELGAVCLDGSPPAVYVRKGDPNNWHVHFEGGGWCYHAPPTLLEDNHCFYRAYGPAIESSTPPHYLGSSAMLEANYSTSPPRSFSYFQSADPAQNPAMHNWSFAFVHYCDGASYTGDLEQPVVYEGKPLFYRGKRVREAVVSYLLDQRDMASAENVVISGTSAGGLGVYLNIDAIRDQIPENVRVRGLASAGFFLDYDTNFPTQMIALAKEQNSSGALSISCKQKMMAKNLSVENCIFPENFVEYLKTPVFALQSRFDTWQLHEIANVSASNQSFVESYGDIIQSRMAPLLAQAMAGANATISHAVWLSSCLTHGLALTSHWVEAEINGVHEWETFSKWFAGDYDRVNRSWIDCVTYKCDSTCP